MERPHERQEVERHVSNSHVERHVSNSHSSFKQTDPELERYKQEIAEARAKQNRELARARPVVEEDLEHEAELERLKQEIAEARAKQNRELVARPVVEEDLEHEGVKCHICGWTGSVRDLKSLPNLPNQVDAEKLCPSCESNNLSSVDQQPPSQPSNRDSTYSPDSAYKSVHKTQYSPTSATSCCGGGCSLL